MNRLIQISLLFLTAAAVAGCGHDQSSGAPENPPADVVLQLGFQIPDYTAAELQQVLDFYSYVDPWQVVPSALKAQAIAYYHANLSQITNRTYLSVVDFSTHASLPRFFIMNMKTGAVTSYHVAHGKGSDPNNTGYATKFSNVSGSNKSSLGYYLTAETYNGVHGYSLRMDGLSTTNSNVRARDIVVHGASYVYDVNIQAGRSDGCFAFPMDDRDTVVNELRGGSIIFAALEK